MRSMATSRYAEGQGSLTATPYASAPGINDVSPLLAKLRRGSGGGGGGGGAQPVGGGTNTRPEPPDNRQERGLDMAADQLRSMQMGAEMAKLRALTSAAPTKQLHGFNMSGTVMEDPEKLSGIQRQIYLPQSSQQVGGFPQSGASLSPDVPMQQEEPDSGMLFRRAALGEALKQSNAGAQLRGLQPPNSAYGR